MIKEKRISGKSSSEKVFMAMNDSNNKMTLNTAGTFGSASKSPDVEAHQFAYHVFRDLILNQPIQVQPNIESLRTLIATITEAQKKNVLSEEEAQAMIRHITARFADSQVNELFKDFVQDNTINSFAFHAVSKRGLVYGR